MKWLLVLIVSTGLFVPVVITATAGGAAAASAKCAALCDKWCTQKFAMKNSEACTQQCQLKHCK